MAQPFQILYEDDVLLAAAKMTACPVQSDASGDTPLQTLLSDFMAERDGKKPFLEAAHRIDRRTSGVVLFGKSHKAVSALDAAFRAHRVRKTYWAVPDRDPEPPTGRLIHKLVRDPRKNRTLAVPYKGDTSPWQGAVGTQLHPATAVTLPKELAILDYRMIGRSDRYGLLEILPLTGKTHQIRAQLAAIGCPLRGDLKYGARRSCHNGLIMLHARTVSFEHPLTGERIEIVSPVPEDEPLWLAFPGAGNGAQAPASET
jgi:23S rRNA pseudouridine1911/1915/1917 synthase